MDFTSLRKSCLLYTLTSDGDGFQEHLESSLLGMYDQANAGGNNEDHLSNYVSKCVVDVVPLFETYFLRHDQIFSGQVGVTSGSNYFYD